MSAFRSLNERSGPVIIQRQSAPITQSSAGVSTRYEIVPGQPAVTQRGADHRRCHDRGLRRELIRDRGQTVVAVPHECERHRDAPTTPTTGSRTTGSPATLNVRPKVRIRTTLPNCEPPCGAEPAWRRVLRWKPSSVQSNPRLDDHQNTIASAAAASTARITQTRPRDPGLPDSYSGGPTRRRHPRPACLWRCPP